MRIFTTFSNQSIARKLKAERLKAAVIDEGAYRQWYRKNRVDGVFLAVKLFIFFKREVLPLLCFVKHRVEVSNTHTTSILTITDLLAPLASLSMVMLKDAGDMFIDDIALINGFRVNCLDGVLV